MTVGSISLALSYPQARGAFLDAAAGAGARLESHRHTATGPEGEPLSIDVAELGSQEAAEVVLVVSGTHGVEGFCGSALQSAWLRLHSGELPAGLRLVMVHALNPYGFAWVRRVNEDNVDLNRNFIDWSRPPPANEEYDEIADLLVPPDWNAAEQERTTAELLAIAEERGFEHLQAVISGGQYTHPAGVFYGGPGPVWSHRWLRQWSAERLSGAERLVVIDLHTGLGPWGVGELISAGCRGEAVYERAASLWGEVTSLVDGDSVSAPLSGDWLDSAVELAPRAEVTAIAVEYGTVDPITVLSSLRADAWLHAHGDPASAGAEQVRAQVRAAFADDDPAWIDACWGRFAEVMAAALGGAR